ncbi:hypothetical protein K502DRAFT_291923 [Neoconidiobolus thromboides FSU 785]|nr:hypothetical protein K502DRAFT_291923 [Neoconidiobolus thromboides FSU 785]
MLTKIIDYLAEQQDELEVLKSIYPEELTIVPSVILEVELTETYPDTIPSLAIKPSTACGLEEEDAQDNLGMGMIFTLASQLKENILDLIKNKANLREKEAEERLMASLKAEESKFIGTKVTPELFLEWKLKFDLEKEALENPSKADFKRNNDKKKLTGRQLFEGDSRLAQSDMQYLEDGDQDVDTTLFERLNLNQREEDSNEENDSSVLNLLREQED